MSSHEIKTYVINTDTLTGDIYSSNSNKEQITINAHEVAGGGDAYDVFGDEPRIITADIEGWLSYLFERTILNENRGSIKNNKKITDLTERVSKLENDTTENIDNITNIETELEKVQEFNNNYTYKPYKDLTEEEAWKLGYPKSEWESERTSSIREFYEEVNKWNQCNRLSCVQNQNKSFEIEGNVSSLSSRIENLESLVEELKQRITTLETQ